MSSNRKIAMPTEEEEAAINAGIAADPDTFEASDEDFAAMRPVRGRPPSAHRKILLSVRYSPEVVAYFKAQGPGWQARMDDALKEWIRAHT